MNSLVTDRLVCTLWPPSQGFVAARPIAGSVTRLAVAHDLLAEQWPQTFAGSVPEDHWPSALADANSRVMEGYGEAWIMWRGRRW